MVRSFALLALLILLAGCETAAEERARRDASDQQRCESFGFELGTEAYANCRLQIDTSRRAAAAALLGLQQRPLYVPPPAAVVRPAPVLRAPNTTTSCFALGNTINCTTQ